MIATLLTAYINILKAVVSLMTTSAQSVFQALKPTITIPLGENLMGQVANNSVALNNTVDYYQGRIVNLLQKLEDKVKNEMTMNEIVLTKND
jgi:hypothetical protein